MRVPLEWLKQYLPIEASAEEIATRLTMGGLEVEGIETSPLGPVLDVYITPNRGDCLSMVGVAREIAALYGLPLRIPSPPPSREGGPVAELTSVTLLAPDLCPRYAARVVRGVKIGPSPQWIQQRLEAAGQRPINNVVDVTNYVMLELGQPLHAFDLDQLAEQRIVVRRATAGEKFTTLDDIERELTDSTLVIADGEKAVAIAGVMGGQNSEVSDTTTNLLLESAHFDPLAVRRASKALGLRTEASYRFERVVDPEGVRRAVDRACELLQEMGQPKAVEGVVDVYPHPVAPRTVSLRVTRAIELLGMDLTSHICADSLRALDFEVRTESEGAIDVLHVQVPAFRPDITLEEDLIEEIGRIYGYENIPETLPGGATTQGGDSPEGIFISRVKQILTACGMQEIVSHSLTAPSFFDAPADAARQVAVRNTLSADIGGLRRSLLPTLLDVAQHNARHGQQHLALCEVGRVWQNEPGEDGPIPVEYIAVAGLLTGPLTEPGWQKDSPPLPADFALTRGIVERLFAELGIKDATFRALQDRADQVPQFHPGRTATISLRGGHPDGIIGEVHPTVAAKFGLRERVYVFEIGLNALAEASASSQGVGFRPLTRFPAVVRDIAPHLPEHVPYAAVASAVRTANMPLLEDFRLTDVFRGGPLKEGTKSLTLSLTFRAADHTLSEAEITEALQHIRTELTERCEAVLA
ncbi:MAG: phenylalanyl-tRNA synthetase beta subunit [Chthonomonadaceae bacterium]|nr:phenylalanyl-tRNA synthetase beta subunit [Chthonomonadaceae bacterium]